MYPFRHQDPETKMRGHRLRKSASPREAAPLLYQSMRFRTDITSETIPRVGFPIARELRSSKIVNFA